VEELDLRDYINVVMDRKWLILGIAAAVTAVALVVSLIQPAVYEGTAEILITEKGSGSDIFGTASLDISSNPERDLQSQVRAVTARSSLEKAIETLDLSLTPEELADTVQVTAMGQTNIISISVRDGDPETAAAIANTLAGLFVDWSRDFKRESINAAAEEVASRLTAAQDELLRLGKSTEGASDVSSAEFAIASQNYATLAAKLEELRISAQLETGSGRILNPAIVPESPIEPSPMRNTVLGLVVGLVFGLGVAFLLEYLDNTIKSSSDAETLLGAPVLGLVPTEKILEKGDRRRTSILAHPGGATAEAYRILRNNLDFINFRHDLKVLLVTSAAPSEGKSTTAANLAVGLAQAGKKVVLLAADFRKPTTAQFLGVRNLIGLSDVLTGARPLQSALQRPLEDIDLHVLTSGKLPPNPSEILGSERMRDLLEELKGWADWVIIDTPPLLAVADGASVARYADGVLLVAKGGVSAREAFKMAGEMIQSAGGRVIGSVIWGLDAVGSRGGSSYGGYYSYTESYNATGEEPAADMRNHRRDSSGVRASARRRSASTSAITAFTGQRGVIIATAAVTAVLAMLALVVYFLDEALGWGLLSAAIVWAA